MDVKSETAGGKQQVRRLQNEMKQEQVTKEKEEGRTKKRRDTFHPGNRIEDASTLAIDPLT
ncbi:hypothetical protein E2562_029321 [Oryza meyeriana var. granulata]|uniref:Uncharacterized protein n=1 Tax=Oryza meyeriana var. granulata TaxID=110450 RepID=A0A6G1E4N1_9ORYZ|nr:hypothetical protein E2562_029321 [Oryza meyeriana var. granulata]